MACRKYTGKCIECPMERCIYDEPEMARRSARAPHKYKGSEDSAPKTREKTPVKKPPYLGLEAYTISAQDWKNHPIYGRGSQ